MTISKELNSKTIKDHVEHLLHNYAETRSSDKHLQWAYLDTHGRLYKKLDDKTYLDVKEAFYTMPSFETIRRIRQKFQEGGHYLGTDEVQEKRQQESNEVKNWAVGQ